MGFYSWVGIIINRIPKLTLESFTLAHSKHILKLVLSYLRFHLVLRKTFSLSCCIDAYSRWPEDRRPSASLVPVPVCFAAKSMIKKHLQVMQYSRYLHQIGPMVSEDKDDYLVCIVCMNCIEVSHEVRVPYNCNHLFHKECLDVWVDQGKETCPLCRSMLLPALNQEDGKDDPWRFERIIYLFGDDSEFLGY